MTGGAGFVRPDPAKGQRGDAAYAEHWSQSHKEVVDALAYRADYIDLLTLEALLADGYSLLDVGCGTAGYHRLLTRQGLIHGIDIMPEMIDAAEKFQCDFGVRNARYTCETFEDLSDAQNYDAVRMVGVYGWYRPWHSQQAILDKVSRLLKPGGVAVLSYVPPTSAAMLAKTLLAPSRTVVIVESRFRRMAERAGLAAMFHIKRTRGSFVFARKEGAR